MFSGPARTWSAGVDLSQPLLNPQRSLYQLDLANAQKTSGAAAIPEKHAERVPGSVRCTDRAPARCAELQAAQEAQVAAQRRANTIALARYRVGYASYFNVIDADRDLFNAELSLSAARLNTQLSVVQLYRALGGGWQPEP